MYRRGILHFSVLKYSKKRKKKIINMLITLSFSSMGKRRDNKRKINSDTSINKYLYKNIQHKNNKKEMKIKEAIELWSKKYTTSFFISILFFIERLNIKTLFS